MNQVTERQREILERAVKRMFSKCHKEKLKAEKEKKYNENEVLRT